MNTLPPTCQYHLSGEQLIICFLLYTSSLGIIVHPCANRKEGATNPEWLPGPVCSLSRPKAGQPVPVQASHLPLFCQSHFILLFMLSPDSLSPVIHPTTHSQLPNTFLGISEPSTQSMGASQPLAHHDSKRWLQAPCTIASTICGVPTVYSTNCFHT